jgi:hypothetical protein
MFHAALVYVLTLVFDGSIALISLNRYKDPETGRRSDAAHAYIYPLLVSGKAPNLKVLTKHQVVRILFEYVPCVMRQAFFFKC